MNDNGRNEFDSTPQGRVAYLESLLDQGEPWVDYGPIFAQFLDDEEPQVRVTAIRGLWYSPDPGLIDRLIEMAEKDSSEQVRAEAISALGVYMYEGEMADYGFDFGPMSEMLREDELPEADFTRAKKFLLGVYADETRSLDEHRMAIEALGFLSDPKVMDLVEEAYNHAEREMKISAIFAMGRSGIVRWKDILARELFSAEHNIQREAIRAVGEIGLTELGRDLWRLTYAEDEEIMLEAIEALGQTGWQEGFERLDELTQHPDPEISQAAEEALDEWFLMSEIQRENDELESDLDWDEED